MNDLLTEFSSPRFWIGVVLVSLVLNIAGAYFVRLLDHGRSRLARLWATRSEQSRAIFQRDVATLRGSDAAQAVILIQENRWRQHSILCFVLFVAQFQVVIFTDIFFSKPELVAVLGLVRWVQIFILLSAAAILVLGFRTYLRATRLHSVIVEAQRLDVELHKARQALATADRAASPGHHNS